MLAESRLNVYIVAADLPARTRERLQAQLEAALRSLPGWLFGMLGARTDALGVRALPLMVEPQADGVPSGPPLGLGSIDGRPAVRLRPRLADRDIDWGGDRRYLVGKGIAYMAAPDSGDQAFWQRWREALEADALREKARAAHEAWREETDLGLLIEVAAACALSPEHGRWADLAAVRAFLDAWRGEASSR